MSCKQEPIEVYEATGWNRSISMLFGRTPKFTCWCGNCHKVQAMRFSAQDFVKGYKKRYPTYTCLYCDTVNYIPIEVS